MSTEGQKHAAKLAKLEQRRKELEDALMRLARDEAEAQEVSELAQEVEQLENQVESARTAANMEKTMTKKNDITKAAAGNRRKAEAELDKLAKSVQQDGETFEKAYLRALDTDIGKALMQTRDDAQELERGGITAMDVADAHKRLNA
jgi:mannose-6-phosphate isomerase class I